MTSLRGEIFSQLRIMIQLYCQLNKKYTVRSTFKEKTRVHNSALFASVVCPVKRRAKNPFDGLSGSGMNTNKSPNESGTFRLQCKRISVYELARMQSKFSLVVFDHRNSLYFRSGSHVHSLSLVGNAESSPNTTRC